MAGCASQETSKPAASPSPAKPASRQAPASISNEQNAQILLDKIKADKKLLVAQNMVLTDAEAKAFWPLYESYQGELMQINQRLGKTIGDYADLVNKGSVPDEQATALLDEVLAVEKAEADLKHAYADKVAAVLPATKAARYLQIETKIRSILKAELAQRIPLIY
jgi:hypothetical protein